MEQNSFLKFKISNWISWLKWESVMTVWPGHRDPTTRRWHRRIILQQDPNRGKRKKGAIKDYLHFKEDNHNSLKLEKVYLILFFAGLAGVLTIYHFAWTLTMVRTLRSHRLGAYSLSACECAWKSERERKGIGEREAQVVCSLCCIFIHMFRVV